MRGGGRCGKQSVAGEIVEVGGREKERRLIEKSKRETERIWMGEGEGGIAQYPYFFSVTRMGMQMRVACYSLMCKKVRVLECLSGCFSCMDG